MVLCAGVAAVLLLVPCPAEAQFEAGWKDWYGHVAAGRVSVSGDAGSVLDDGWGLSAGATYKPEAWPVGVIFDLGYNAFDVTAEALATFESTGGDGAIWSATAGAIWSPRLRGRIGVAVQAGIGGYVIDASLEAPGLVCGSACPPAAVWWCQWGCDPGTVISDSVSSVELGYSIAALVSYELGRSSSVYVELRYHRVQSEVETAYMPLAVGFRW
jgi:hypothetical protein